MKAIVGLLIAATLAVGSGCAKTDWIDRTLVTVDVTGMWYGHHVGITDREVSFELRQEGSRVTGLVRTPRYGTGTSSSTPIDATVAGDVFRFKDSRGDFEGELTVRRRDDRSSVVRG